MFYVFGLYKIVFLSILEPVVNPEFVNNTSGGLEHDEYSWRNAQVDGLILTLTCYTNYGCIIQRYALKHVLEQNGKNFHTTYIRHIPYESHAIFENTRAFTQKYLGGEDFDRNKLQGYKNYVVGSDQVWRNVIPRFWNWEILAPYFCEFVDEGLQVNSKVNRISYAASFGVRNVNIAMNKSEQARVGPLLKKFSAISVREESGRLILKKTFGLESIVVLDPALLLNRCDYSKLIESSTSKSIITGELFYYLIHPDKKIMEFITNISRKLGVVKTGIVLSRKSRLEPVEQWLKGFRDAKFVFTDAYHGVVLSIVNNKEFVAVSGRSDQTRFDSLLGALGLTNRLIKESSLKEGIFSDLGSIDWKTVNDKLERLRSTSVKWLLGNLV